MNKLIKNPEKILSAFVVTNGIIGGVLGNATFNQITRPVDTAWTGGTPSRLSFIAYGAMNGFIFPIFGNVMMYNRL